ncbi:RidA family protein [Tardiphaga sp.]|jgi:2-iminobutanoate/2-iminopropanoate deaminase|uniref:RidA family protein n=1 Tax=Tardiphaga sp. TaxID=1926292 RepID=UPI0037DA608F
MITKLNPATTYSSPSFSQGMLVQGNAQTLYMSGQCGIAKDGTIPEQFAPQFALAMDNVLAVLKEGGMGPADIVKMTFYLTNAEDLAAMREIRDQKLEGHLVAMTVLIISKLVLPQLSVEIECTAVKAL